MASANEAAVLCGVSRRLMRPAFVAAREVGVDVEDLLARLGADWVSIADPDARVDYELAGDMMAILEGRVPGAFPLRAALHTTGSDFGLLHYLWASSPTYRTGFIAVQRFHEVAAGEEETGRISLHEHGEDTVVRFSTGHTSPFFMEAIFLGLIVANAPHGAVEPGSVGDRRDLVRDLAQPGEPPVLVPKVREARFAHPRPDYADGYYAIFARDESLVFDAQHFELVFRRASLDLPRRSAYPHLYELLSKDAEQLVAAGGKERLWTRRTEDALMVSLGTQTPTADGIATTLAMSTSTLHRRLQSEGTTFRRVLEHLRCRQARAYLKRQELSILEVAYLLGYSNVGAFNRAFRRWEHRTPGEYRRSVLP